MSWDWDAEDVDLDDDNRKIWVLVIPKTMAVMETDGGNVPPMSEV